MFMIEKYYIEISKRKIYSLPPKKKSKWEILGLLEYSNIPMIVRKLQLEHLITCHQKFVKLLLNIYIYIYIYIQEKPYN